jgi:NarL family two-component system response regulator LiaR
MDAIRVLVVDDHPVVRKGIGAMLAGEIDIRIVGEATNGKQAVEQARDLHPDVILMDLVMPEMDGIEAIRLISARDPEVRILVMTSFAADDKVFPSIKAGAIGYLLKDADPEDLAYVIRRVHRGELCLSPMIAQRVIQELNHPSNLPLTPEPLTTREVEVLQFLAQGLGNQEIARQLKISNATTRTHVSNILSKLHLANRVQAALYALNNGLILLEKANPPQTFKL